MNGGILSLQSLVKNMFIDNGFLVLLGIYLLAVWADWGSNEYKI